MRTTQLCRAIWLLKPCVSLSTDGKFRKKVIIQNGFGIKKGAAGKMAAPDNTAWAALGRESKAKPMPKIIS